MTLQVQRVVIVGADAAAWIAATALKRAFARRGLDVIVVPPKDVPAAATAYHTLPSIRALHALMGIEERELLRKTGATFKVATDYVGWRGDGSRYVHPFGEIGVSFQGAAFYKYLAHLAGSGRARRMEDFSLASMAAQEGRFAWPKSDTRSLFATYTYAYHLDGPLYCALLRANAEKLGVQIKQGALADISLAPDGSIEALTLTDGDRVAGDLFLDCSGAQALLMSRLAPDDFEDWSAWLPCDRIATASAPPSGSPGSATQACAGDAGWTWRIPLQHRVDVGHVYASRFLSDDQAAAHLRNAIALPEPPDVSFAPLRLGRRTQFWRKNCVAIGDSAGKLEPLIGADLHLVQSAVSNLVGLFPLDARNAVEATEYNNTMAAIHDGVRDFVIALYRLSRRDGPFWAKAQAAEPPQRLTNKLEEFGICASINLLDHESFEEEDWASLFLAQGWIPDDVDPLVAIILAGIDARAVDMLAAKIRDAAMSMPSQRDFLERQGLRFSPAS